MIEKKPGLLYTYVSGRVLEGVWQKPVGPVDCCEGRLWVELCVYDVSSSFASQVFFS
jgi:hypothetical protein